MPTKRSPLLWAPPHRLDLAPCPPDCLAFLLAAFPRDLHSQIADRETQSRPRRRHHHPCCLDPLVRHNMRQVLIVGIVRLTSSSSLSSKGAL